MLDCSKFESIRQTINRLRALENVEAARYLSGDFTIWGEMHRIAQRQFSWQRGYFNAPQFYRYAYLYAQGKCADYFKEAYDFEITDLIFTGFGLFSAYLTDPWVPRKTSVPEVGLTDEIVQRAFPMMSCSRDEGGQKPPPSWHRLKRNTAHQFQRQCCQAFSAKRLLSTLMIPIG